MERHKKKQIAFGKRIAFIKTKADQERMRLANRRLVVEID